MNRFELSKAYQKAAQSAREQEEILFPSKAMELLKINYGKTIDRIKGTTLYKMIYHLGLYNGTEMEESEIWEAINEFMEEEN